MSDIVQLRGEVRRTLGQASDEQLVRVMQFIDRLPSRSHFDDIVATVRHRLAVVRPARPMTLARVLTVPLEDLLLDAGTRSAADWLVPRDVLQILHRLVLEALPADLAQRLTADCANRLMNDNDAVLGIGRQLWPVATTVLEQRLQDPSALSRLEKLSDAVGPRLQRLSQLLACADQLVEDLLQLPPKPMGRLSETQALAALALLTNLRAGSVDLFRGGCTILVRRSSNPGEVLRMVAEHDFGLKGDERKGLLTDATRECLDDVEATAALMGRQQGSAAATADAALKMASMIESLERVPSSVPVSPQQLAFVKAKASEAVLRTYESGIGGDVYAALDGIASGLRAGDDDVLAAECMAIAMKKVEQAGGRLGQGYALNRIVQRELSRYRKALELPPSSRRDDAAGNLMDGVRLIEILFGPDEAMRICEQL